ncbi:KATNB1-like protein 1 isoform X1 [Pleuronectes platessa]|uniref:KATNB1-like protein 1 isoform X1 n=1 Tax=Pleuronectes platessa TaxID=8262 RepID=UPI00232A3498|nr:KATNB1-like protein 1 isoform X1 [Pleuronectes platessa]XP_053290357.1 KATNB1-like protein 1 isoform X1 [Pleuronectes platessa]
MDSNSEDGDYQGLELPSHPDAAQYIVTYPQWRNITDVDYDKNEEFNTKRYSASRSGTNPRRVKRVVSCKRKTHHQTLAWRMPLGSGRTFDAANKDEMSSLQDVHQEIFEMDPLEFPLNVSHNHRTGRTGSEQADCSALSELSKDHSAMIDVLFGRNLRLKVAFTLWHRNVGELLTFFLRIQDIGVFVDFLPLISRSSIDEDSLRITIGFCVDLFPLVTEVLTKPYEEYLIVGLNWIHSVLKKWWQQLRASGYSGSSEAVLEKNFQVFNQLLMELWLDEPSLKFAPGAAGEKAKVIDSYLSQLT